MPWREQSQVDWQHHAEGNEETAAETVEALAHTSEPWPHTLRRACYQELNDELNYRISQSGHSRLHIHIIICWIQEWLDEGCMEQQCFGI